MRELIKLLVNTVEGNPLIFPRKMINEAFDIDMCMCVPSLILNPDFSEI